MPQVTMRDPQTLTGKMAYDSDGEEVGQIRAVYLDKRTRDPEWVALDHGQAGTTLVPLARATFDDDYVELAFPRAQIEAAPYQVQDLAHEISDPDETALYLYYGLTPANGSSRRRSSRRTAKRAADTAAGQAQQVASSASDQAQEVASATKAQGEQVVSTAKEQGQQVATTARQHGERLASVGAEGGQQLLETTTEEAKAVVASAKEQAAQVAEEATAQARNLAQETKSRVEDETVVQVRTLAENLRRLAEEAQALVEGRPEEAATISEYVSMAADKLLSAADQAYDVADNVSERGLGSLLEDLQSFGRRRPGFFLLGAAVAGLAAGRVVQANSDQEERPALPAASQHNRHGTTGRPGRGRAAKRGAI